jgi:hypothetical protein
MAATSGVPALAPAAAFPSWKAWIAAPCVSAAKRTSLGPNASGPMDCSVVCGAAALAVAGAVGVTPPVANTIVIARLPANLCICSSLH